MPGAPTGGRPRWKGKFGGAPDVGFFGLTSHATEPVYVGRGGMHRLPGSVLADAKARHPDGLVVHAGVRVASVRSDGGSGGGGGGEAAATWTLLGTSGTAAFHDTAEADAAKAEPTVLGAGFDAVLLTDASSAFGEWHRASAGLPAEFAARVRERVRVPLFSTMVAFDRPLHLAYDAITFRDEAIWFAARTIKPGLEASGAPGGAECWTLVSTPGFAVAEISAVPMQDAKTGAFKPQEDGYLNTGPAPALLEAFQRHAARLRSEEGGDGGSPPPAPKLLYLQGQRWGSALPACAAHHGRDRSGAGPTTSTVCGVRYEQELLPLVYDRPDAAGDETDFIADDARGLYYAGDFCSHRCPGFETAALSALDAAEHISERFTPWALNRR